MAGEIPSRLTPLDRGPELLPLVRARQLTLCLLYWIPVSGLPVPHRERRWLNALLDRLSLLLAKKHGLRPEVFLQYKTLVPDLRERFIDQALELRPLMGFAQRPGQEIPPTPTIEDLKGMFEGGEKYDIGKFVGDFCYWFVRKNEGPQREQFFGHGGMTILYLPPDPKTKVASLRIPKWVREHPSFGDLFKLFDPDQVVAGAHALGDEFRRKSVELYAEELKKNIQLKGIPFVIPWLSTRDFFDRPQDESKKWFELFDVYVNESPSDKGILIASKVDIEEDLIGILKEMKDEELIYPGERP
jgi:hypothetical protein